MLVTKRTIMRMATYIRNRRSIWASKGRVCSRIVSVSRHIRTTSGRMQMHWCNPISAITVIRCSRSRRRWHRQIWSPLPINRWCHQPTRTGKFFAKNVRQLKLIPSHFPAQIAVLTVSAGQTYWPTHQPAPIRLMAKSHHRRALLCKLATWTPASKKMNSNSTWVIALSQLRRCSQFILKVFRLRKLNCHPTMRLDRLFRICIAERLVTSA